MQANQTQWYLKIKNVEALKYDIDNEYYVPTLSFRVFPIINDVEGYCYPPPQKLKAINLQKSITQSFPIPIDEEPYRIKFEGIEEISSTKQIYMLGTKEDIYEVNNLPSGEQTYKLIKNATGILDSDSTTITIYYEIVNHK